MAILEYSGEGVKSFGMPAMSRPLKGQGAGGLRVANPQRPYAECLCGVRADPDERCRHDP